MALGEALGQSDRKSRFVRKGNARCEKDSGGLVFRKPLVSQIVFFSMRTR
jgi:hypothetical protein